MNYTNWMLGEEQKYNTEVLNTSIMDSLQKNDFEGAKLTLAESLAAGNIQSPAAYDKWNSTIDYASTVYTRTNEGLSYVTTRDMTNLTAWKDEILNDKTLTPESRKSMIASVEQAHANQYLDDFHGVVQATWKQTGSIDAAVVKGQEELNKVLLADNKTLGGDDVFKSRLHTQINTELNRYRAMITKRDDQGSTYARLNAPLQMAYGHSDDQAKNGNDRFALYTGATLTNKGKVDRSTQMSRKDILSNKKTPQGYSPLAMASDMAAIQGILPKDFVDAVNSTTNGSMQDQAMGLDALQQVMSTLGPRAQQIMRSSGINEGMQHRLALAPIIGSESATKMVSEYNSKPEHYNAMYDTREARKSYEDAWEKSSGTIKDTIASMPGYETGFFDSNPGASRKIMADINLVAKQLYPMVHDANLAIKAATHQVIGRGDVVKDYTRGEQVITPREYSLQNALPDSTPEDMEVLGDEIYKTLVEKHNGFEIDRTNMTYRTAPTKKLGVTNVEVSYRDETGMLVNSVFSVEDGEIPSKIEAKAKTLEIEAKKNDALQQKYILEQAEEKQKAHKQLTSQEQRALMDHQNNTRYTKFVSSTFEAVHETAIDMFEASAKADEELAKHHLDMFTPLLIPGGGGTIKSTVKAIEEISDFAKSIDFDVKGGSDKPKDMVKPENVRMPKGL